MSGLSYRLDAEAADVNRNDRIDFGDFLILSANFGRSDAKQEDGNIDGDGKVSFADFLYLSTQFG